MSIENSFTLSKENLSDAIDGSETPAEAREKDENYARKLEEKDDGGEIDPVVNPEKDHFRKISLNYDKMRADPANKGVSDEELIARAERMVEEK
jgi:hypothetical protein